MNYHDFRSCGVVSPSVGFIGILLINCLPHTALRNFFFSLLQDFNKQGAFFFPVNHLFSLKNTDYYWIVFCFFNQSNNLINKTSHGSEHFAHILSDLTTTLKHKAEQLNKTRYDVGSGRFNPASSLSEGVVSSYKLLQIHMAETKDKLRFQQNRNRKVT